MITGELRSKVDRIWDTMWSGGISNPLSVIEQLTYLLFIKRLDELHTLRERKAARTRGPWRQERRFAFVDCQPHDLRVKSGGCDRVSIELFSIHYSRLCSFGSLRP